MPPSPNCSNSTSMKKIAPSVLRPWRWRLSSVLFRGSFCSRSICSIGSWRRLRFRIRNGGTLPCFPSLPSITGTRKRRSGRSFRLWMRWSSRPTIWTNGYSRKRRLKSWGVRITASARSNQSPHLKNQPIISSQSLNCTATEWPSPPTPNISPTSETLTSRHDALKLLDFPHYLNNKLVGMDRKVISLHKHLQGPKSPNADLGHARLDKVAKKKNASQASLK